MGSLGISILHQYRKLATNTNVYLRPHLRSTSIVKLKSQREPDHSQTGEQRSQVYRVRSSEKVEKWLYGRGNTYRIQEQRELRLPVRSEWRAATASFDAESQSFCLRR